MAKIIQMFECEYCYKTLRKTKKGIDNHEIKCFSNPATKSCITCENFCDANYPISIEERKQGRKCYQGVQINVCLQTNCDKWSSIIDNYEPDNSELI